MLRQWTIGLIGCLLLTAACSKDDDGTPPTPPPPPDGVFTISNLVFSPDKVPINLMAPTFFVTGNLNYVNAKGGVVALRLTTSQGFDTTLDLQGKAPAPIGTIVGNFELTRPVVPVQISFEVSLTDAGGRTSNKLSGTIYIAVDDSGQKWGHITIGIKSVFNDIQFVNNMFVSVTNAGTIGTSPNGIWWHEQTVPFSDWMQFPLRGITYTGTQYVAVGDRGNIFTSPDAQNWTNRSMPENQNNNFFYSVASNGQRIVAVGENSDPVGRSDIVTSEDGITWTRNNFSVTQSDLRSVIWTGNRFVAVGSGLILTSADGLNWTNHSDETKPNRHFYDVVQAGNKTIAIGYQVVAISEKNGNWTWYTLPSNVDVYALAWSGNRLVGVGNGIFTSTDGVNWTQTLPGNNLAYNYKCVAWGQFKYVAAGKDEMTVSVSP